MPPSRGSPASTASASPPSRSAHILDRPAVAGVIVGTRLGVSEHIAANTSAFDVALDAEDEATLAPVLAKGRDLMLAIGDCGDEYR